MSGVRGDEPIRVLVVDDSQFIRHMFSAWMNRDPMIKVVGTAADAMEARDMIKALNPDVITLDVEMPMMDGISFLEKLMRLRPMPVVMVSTLTAAGAETTVRALELGAVDYVNKPASAGESGWELALTDITRKVKAAAHARPRAVVAAQAADGEKAPTRLNTSLRALEPQIIGIGASTGGVEAIAAVLTQLPSSMPPIVITQHMPPLFTASFARRLDAKCALKVIEAQHQQPIVAGCAYIAPGSYHLRVHWQSTTRQYCCRLDEEEPVSGHRPSVDVLFTSLAEQAKHHAVGVILTGMGQDGARGLKKMRDSGARTLGQDQASCVVYGMPRAAQEAGAVMRQCPIEGMAQAMIHACEEVSHGAAA